MGAGMNGSFVERNQMLMIGAIFGIGLGFIVGWLVLSQWLLGLLIGLILGVIVGWVLNQAK